jgi:hypothetical protein
MRRFFCTALAATVLTLTGCTGAEVGDEDLTFRQEDHIFDDLAIYPGPTATGTPLWEMTQGDLVFEGPAEEQNLLMLVSFEEIMDQDGFVVCTREERELVDVITPHGEPQVVLSLLGPYVFAGEIDLWGKSMCGIREIMEEQLLYTITPRRVFDGRIRSRDVLLTASSNMTKTGEMARLVVGALAAGECGSNGL